MTAVAQDPAVRFAMFDWLDESGREQGETYEERLRMLELADKLHPDFYCYHLAEHHFTELSTVPSPNLFLSAVAQRTRRLRLGALSYVMPLYEPIRLLEEICMLDQLSGGRVELGLSRGSTGEHIQDDPDKAREMFKEVLDILLMGLSTGEVDYRGKYFNYDRVVTRLRPIQRPYPPLWYPTSNADSIPWVAAQGISTAFAVHLSSGFDQVAGMVGRYRSEYEAHTSDSGRLNGHVARANVGFSLHMHVAESDARARAQARPAFDQFMHNFTYRFVRRGMPNRYTDRADFDGELERGRLLVGSPETVRQQLARYVEQSRANYVIGCFSFGSLTVEQILSSVNLFAREVMPFVRERAAAGPRSRR
jgi:alkanesulfonate monooxygenase SsuD/methylene tetrahydromethanopterin reductase-like flavin-dependent oxidoreductase (luciferase family)